MLLGLMLAAGVVDRISVNTHDRRSYAPGATKDINMLDLQYATVLHERLGLSWRSQSTITQIPISPENSLSVWQSIRSNCSYEYIPRSFARVTESPVVNLMGSGGELFRSYIGQSTANAFKGWWKKAGGVKDQTSDDLRMLFADLVPPASIPKQLFEEAADDFVNSMMDGHDGSDVLTALDRQYANFRSRTHAGGTTFARVDNAFTIYPLRQPAFVEAGKRLPRSDSDDGRVMFDIFLNTEPELLTLPFASPPWPTRFMKDVEHRVDNWERYSGVDSLRSLEETNSNNAKNIQTLWTATSRDSHAAFVDDRIGENRGLISAELDSHISAEERAPFFDRLCITAVQKENTKRAFLSKTESVRDALFGSTEAVRTWNVSPGSNTAFDVRQSVRVNETGRPVADQGEVHSRLGQIGFSRVEMDVERTGHGSGYLLNVRNLPAGAKVAVYWYVDGSRVAVDGYAATESVGLRSDIDAEPHRVRATVFLKWDHLHQASRIYELAPS